MECKLTDEHWQLGTYFQHRFLELSMRIDSASQDEFERAVEDSISRSLSREYVLTPSLTPKFLRFVLQIVHRYNCNASSKALEIDDVEDKLKEHVDSHDLLILLDMFKRVSRQTDHQV